MKKEKWKLTPKPLAESSLRVSFIAEIENAIARTDGVEERQASVWGLEALGILSSADVFLHGNVKRAVECVSRVQVRGPGWIYKLGCQ